MHGKRNRQELNSLWYIFKLFKFQTSDIWTSWLWGMFLWERCRATWCHCNQRSCTGRFILSFLCWWLWTKKWQNCIR